MSSFELDKRIYYVARSNLQKNLCKYVSINYFTYSKVHLKLHSTLLKRHTVDTFALFIFLGLFVNFVNCVDHWNEVKVFSIQWFVKTWQISSALKNIELSSIPILSLIFTSRPTFYFGTCWKSEHLPKIIALVSGFCHQEHRFLHHRCLTLIWCLISSAESLMVLEKML